MCEQPLRYNVTLAYPPLHLTRLEYSMLLICLRDLLNFFLVSLSCRDESEHSS